MKKDNGLVEHVKGYFNNNEGNLKESLKLDDDFRFDTDELIDNPESKSRKVFNAMVDGIVKERTSEMLTRENAQRQQQASKAKIQQDAEDFRVRNNLSVDEMKQFLDTAENRFKGGYLSFDDMYSLINRDNVNQNVAKATKEDMLTQMKNVREIPTSQGNANNAGKKQSVDDDVFDALRGVDSKIDNLFG
jgi:Tfp pilus assembly protein PilV